MVSLGRQRAAFSLPATAALECLLASLAHPETVLALLAAQRDAGAEALRRLAELRRRGTPGATALAAELDASSCDGFLCDAVLSSRVLAEHHPGAMATGLFPYGPFMGQLVADLKDVAGTAPSARSSSTLRR